MLLHADGLLSAEDANFDESFTRVFKQRELQVHPAPFLLPARKHNSIGSCLLRRAGVSFRDDTHVAYLVIPS